MFTNGIMVCVVFRLGMYTRLLTDLVLVKQAQQKFVQMWLSGAAGNVKVI